MQPPPYITPFKEQKTPADLARALSCSEEILVSLASDPEQWVKRHKIPKRRGKGHRVVWEAKTPEVRQLYKALAHHLHAFLANRAGYPHESAHGYLARRSIRTNAEPHVQKKRLLRADIRDFFSSITGNRIEQALEMHTGKEMSSLISRLHVIDGGLALGLSSSPIIANFIATPLDESLANLASDLGCTYTRYADDITFSSNQLLPDVKDVEEILKAHSFSLNQRKVRIVKPGQSMFVTGLNVEHPNGPTVPRKMKSRIRQEFHYARRYGLREHLEYRYRTIQSGINRIEGRIAFIKGIEKGLGDQLYREWRTLISEAGMGHLRLKHLSHQTNCVSDNLFDSELTFVGLREISALEIAKIPSETHVSFIIDETKEIPVPPNIGEKSVALGIAVVEQTSIQSAVQHLTQVLNDAKKHPYNPKAAQVVEKSGLHFSEADPCLRYEIVKAVSSIPVRMFIGFSQRRSEENLSEVYLRILGRLMPERMAPYDNKRIRMLIERTPDISERKIRERIEHDYLHLSANQHKRPAEKPLIEFVGKDEILIALPDVLLGVWRRYATEGHKRQANGEHAQATVINYFEELRAKYRLIINVDTNEAYTQRKPFKPFAELT